MAKTKFTDEELTQALFFEVVKHPDGPNAQRTEFHGFYTDHVLMRSRVSRQSWKMVEHWHQRNGKEIPLSQYLYFLAGMFAEIEQQNEPIRDNPCAEIPLRGFMDRTNLASRTEQTYCLKPLGGSRYCNRHIGHPGECSSA